MMFNAEELTSVSEDLDWTLEDFKLGDTIARSCEAVICNTLQIWRCSLRSVLSRFSATGSGLTLH